jgi:hypothetical protein
VVHEGALLVLDFSRGMLDGGVRTPPPHAPHGRSTPDSLLLLLLNTISTLDPYI